MEESSFYFGPEEGDINTPVEKPVSIFEGGIEEDPTNDPVNVPEPDPVEEEQYDENGNLINPEQQEEPSDFVSQLLKAKNIDRNNITITEEDGTVTTVNFDDLSDDEKAFILSGDAPAQNDFESSITDSEIETLNFLRTNKINSLQDFANAVAQQAIDKYIAEQSEQVQRPTEIDGYSDDEIIAYDFIQRFGEEMTDEEIDSEIDRLKQDEEAYKKRVNLLRTTYKNQEEAQRKLYEDEQVKVRQANEEAFVNAYTQAANNINTIQDVDLEPEDKQAILDFALTKDSFGNTELSKALNDPEQVLKICWFLKYGEWASQAKRDYFAKQLSAQRAALAKTQPKPTPKAVTRKTTPQSQSRSSASGFKF